MANGKTTTQPEGAKAQYAGEQAASDGDQPLAEVPRFMGRQIPPLDRLLITVIPPVLIIAAVIWVIVDSDGAAETISAMRTFVTGEFTWLFIIYSLVALGVCIRAAFSKFSDVRIGCSYSNQLYALFCW